MKILKRQLLFIYHIVVIKFEETSNTIIHPYYKQKPNDHDWSNSWKKEQKPNDHNWSNSWKKKKKKTIIDQTNCKFGGGEGGSVGVCFRMYRLEIMFSNSVPKFRIQIRL